ncbi:four-domain proteases inhibitor-like [Cherax quadricarinatus]|uniref:four-domain proteases inhibitor-like n=1 Tax=Cherax quadricarinatus TaxID=27406 RepID=UPI00387E97BD
MMRSLAWNTALLLLLMLGFVLSRPRTCDYYCPHVYSPVCGSDGNTYGNSCELSIAACRNPWINLKEVHSGPCGLECFFHCPQVIDPVCGSNKHTYLNVCELSLAVCLSQEGELTMMHKGPCRSDIVEEE